MSTPVIRHPGEFRWETRLLGVTTLMLTVIGIATCYAAGAYVTEWFNEATQQGIAAVVGAVVFFAAAYLDYRIWRKLALPLFLGTLFGLVIIGVVAVIWQHAKAPGTLDKLVPYTNGAHRWIKLGAKIQVAEIARFTLAVWLAAHAAVLGKKVRDLNEGFIPLIGVIAVVCLLVAIEPSVTMAITLGVIGVTVIFTAGARVPHLAIAVLVAVVAVVLVLKFNSLRSKRHDTFQTGAVNCIPDGQECQGVIGFGRGGVLGRGFGNGTQKLGHTPEAYSDYLLSVIGEEWGFVGVTFVVLCFGVFCWMGFRSA